MRAIEKWAVSLIGTALVCTMAYLWLDRPIAFAAYGHHAYQATFAKLTLIPEPLAPLAAIIFVIVGLWLLAGRPLAPWGSAALLASISVLVAELTKNELKYVFGRTWPETFVQNNPSLIRDGVFGFNFFHGGAGYASFPSGHTTAICALVSVLWMMWPRGWPLYCALVLAVVVGLIGADYHFLSDIIAGGFLGTTIGWMTVTAWRTRVSSPR